MIPLLLFLILGTVSDIKNRSIPAILFLIFGMLGLLEYMLYGRTALINELMGIILGIVFIAVSIISENRLGMGDALAILVTGVFLGGMEASCALLCAMLISAFSLSSFWLFIGVTALRLFPSYPSCWPDTFLKSWEL